MNSQYRSSRLTRVISQWFLRASSRVGLTGLPFQIRALLGLGFVFSLGRNIAFPYLAMFLTGSRVNGGLQFDPSLIGFMIMIGSLANTFALLVTGNLCDRFGRKRMLIFSMIILAVLTACFAFVTSYVEFLLLYAATGVIGAFFDPAQSAMVADLVNPERREEVYGLSYMIGNIGTMVGPPIGGFIASTNGYPVLFVYAAVFAAVAAGGLVLSIKESYTPEEGSGVSVAQFAGIFKDRVFVLFCLMGALTNLVYSQLYGLLSVYTQYVGFEPYIFGAFFSVNGAMVVALQIPIRKGAVKIGAARAFIVAQFLYALGFTYFMFAVSFAQFLIGVIVLTLGEITFVPASSGFVANLAPADMRGRYMAITGLFFGIGGAAGSQIAFSLFASLMDKKFVWGVLGLIGFATLVGYAFLAKMAGRRKPSI
ncbi:MAG: MFS transporter [Candidatus Bathyarchaeia archaeon]